MIESIAKVHEKGILHRDIKPENFVLDTENKVFLIDFGLSRLWVQNLRKMEHILPRKTETITGTSRYTSKFNHNGSNLSRRDDLISLGYVIILMMKGRLPWSHINKSDGESI